MCLKNYVLDMESAILVDRNLNVARGMSKSTPSLSIAKVEHD